MPSNRTLACVVSALLASVVLGLIGYHTNGWLCTIMGQGYADTLTVLVLMVACFVLMVVLFFVLPDEVGDFLGPPDEGDPNDNQKNHKGK